MEVHIAGDGAYFGAEAGDLVSQHARCWDLDRIVPIVVIVAQSVRKVQNSHFGNIAGVLSNVEMCGLDRALCNGVRHQEEIKSSIDDFALLNEALIDVGTLRRVVNEGLVLCVLRLLEEALAHTLVHNDQRDLGAHRLVRVRVVRIHTVLLLNDGIELLEFEVDDLLAH